MKVKKTLFLIAITTFLSFTGNTFCQLPVSTENQSWGTYFNEAGLDGTFVLQNLQTRKSTVYNSERAEIRYLPASTFKIMNTLIGLENNTVSNIDEVFKWDSIQRPYESWNQDLSLREAFKVSAVWVYQELARRTGRPAIEYWIEKCGYGNKKTGPQIDRFWLNGEIAISANEQIEFLRLLIQEGLPFSRSVQQQVKQIMFTDSVPGKKLYAKTGWAARIEKQIGWYVGFVEDGQKTWIFAINIDIKNPEDTRYRTEISRKILDSEGIYPTGN
jgi:beta-lactamase class D